VLKRTFTSYTVINRNLFHAGWQSIAWFTRSSISHTWLQRWVM